MSGRRARGGRGTTFVNNVRGPTSALTSFLNERGIRRANPAPAPAPAAPAQRNPTTSAASESSSPSPSGSSSASAAVTPARPRSARARAAAAVAAKAGTSSQSESVDVETMSVDGEDEEMVSVDEESSSDDDLIAITLPARVATRATRSRAAAASATASTSAAASSSSKASSSKAAASKAAAAKNSRKNKKKDDSDDSNDEDFHDITGFVSRSKFSHKGRMPQGSNKIEFCSRCRARFTVKAGTSPVMDDSGEGLLCPTCAAASSGASTPVMKVVKKSRRKIQKAEIECQVPTLQDLCIQKIANCIEDVEAFGDISDLSMVKICKIISRNRSLNSDTIQLFLDPRHTELSLYDCTDITAPGLQNVGQFCPRLQSLNLVRCGRILDDTIDYYGAHLTELSALNLSGPFMVTDAAFIRLFETIGSRFRQFSLEHSYRFSIKSAEALCRSCPRLTRLNLGKCTLMDDEWLAPIAQLTSLTELSLTYPKDGGKGLTTEPMVKLLMAIGSGLESLDLEGCIMLEDAVLTEAIRPSCVRLERLNIAGCEEFTTEGVAALFKEWKINRGLSYLNLRKCIMLGDEALAAVVHHSRETLEELDINGLDELTKAGVQRLSECEQLVKLDVSWVRAMDDEVMELFVQSNLKLEQIMVWGDHRMTECCPTRRGLRIIGREGDFVDLKFRVKQLVV
ncbi:hypothetical protein BGZ94_008849 [Podila epigama]|nr:hypothetical protein BGZ94_008849 [Podila epigama]